VARPSVIRFGVELSKGIVAAVALGSNLGDRHTNIARGFVALAGLPRSRFLIRSAVIETAPMPVGAVAFSNLEGLGGPYLNAVALVKTLLEPAVFLEWLLKIERDMGRVRDPANQACPRTLDLDLVLFGSVVLDTPTLKLPHPRLHEREFVLKPLAEVAPAMVIPGRERTVHELLRELAR
jgi:2-amino-4-hydroxy-6-hydroxymethyldihydropteridine diphosphokinase